MLSPLLLLILPEIRRYWGAMQDLESAFIRAMPVYKYQKWIRFSWNVQEQAVFTTLWFGKKWRKSGFVVFNVSQ